MAAKEVKINKLSYCSVPIEIFSSQNSPLAIASSFIYKIDDDYYLITNWHNFTGKNPNNKEPINGSFVLPSKIKIKLLKTEKPYISWGEQIFDLLDDKSNPIWFVHPVHGEKIDVAILKISINSEFIVKPINEYSFDNFKIEIADDVFILGFPYGITGAGSFPIWKRGTVATEPDIDYQNLPQLLVDTATREGMSGSPVIFRRSGLHNKEIGINDDSIFGTIEGFVGIYSGRYKKDEDKDAQLGIVWKKEVIEEIIRDKRVDSNS